MMKNTPRILLLALLLLGVAQITACASNEAVRDDSQRVEYDPLEPMNRRIHNFNMALDRVALGPLARGYRKVVPSPIRRGITNFFSNLTTPRSALNNFLQGKPGRGFNELGRFVFNSTLGIGGLFDVAGAGGMERYDENFGQTLTVWGVPEGPYIVLPVWGPNMMSDAFSLPIDYGTDLWPYYDNTSVRDKVWLVRVVDLRYRLLTADSILNDSQDPYITIREAFRQNRTFRVYDGDPPSNEEYYEDELFDEFFEDEEQQD
jgi:phospholipid-binding lipoprotein MlaA